ncbi:MAG: succinylglutamate desuccinylase/aspartoacylase family protein [Bdellovibrionota bacterium]|nr:succinylglutamate desuccinylase/aspartoacylase family protein [Bdellovibrionota bacterium]
MGVAYTTEFIKNNIETFKAFFTKVNKERFTVKELAPYIYELNPTKEKSINKVIGLMALNHGNEVGGLFVLLEFLSLLDMGLVNLPGKTVIGLGSVESAKLGKRFFEKDLNRCYGDVTGEGKDFQRAKIVMEAFKECQMSLDLHQTQTPSAHPFFPMTFNSKTFDLIRAIDPQASIIPQKPYDQKGKGVPFSHYLVNRGCTAVTVELGTMSLDYKQIYYGVHLILKLLNYNLGKKPDEFRGSFFPKRGPVFPPGPDAWLRSDLGNFSEIKKGEVIGDYDGGKKWIADEGGFLAFPKAIRGLKRTQANENEPIYILLDRDPDYLKNRD